MPGSRLGIFCQAQVPSAPAVGDLAAFGRKVSSGMEIDPQIFRRLALHDSDVLDEDLVVEV